jgi:hypothetical protein
MNGVMSPWLVFIGILCRNELIQLAEGLFETVMRQAPAPVLLSAAKGHMSKYDIQQ